MITLNGITTAQPTDITEERLQIQHDNESLDGSLQRDYLGEKMQSTLVWQRLKLADYQQLIALFTGGAAAVAYTNTLSNYAGGTLSFTGLATVKESSYVRGATGLRPLQVVIRQV